jgi:Ni/Fe-hydrogenase subunit HybB-like protein
MNRRLVVLKTVLWGLVGVLAAVTVVRFTRGLGAVTDLSDAAPWGLWIGFDVMAGVALAAGGFVLAGTVYIFGLERYRPFVRPAILTAFLGYIAVAVGLLYDLGLPWHIWHPVIYWQYHSVLFEVAACVMCYLTVLTLEFAPVVLEHPWFARPLFQKVLSGLKRVTIGLVIAGIILSTLHQSSLGSLFLITPYRLHPLWYSPIIYVLFFVSAVGLGLMMVVLESLLAAAFLRHKLHVKLLAGLGKAAAVVLGLYTVLRLGDLAVRGVLPALWEGSWQSALFMFELGISAVIPAGLLLLPRVRSSVAGLAVCSSMTVAGMVLNRIDVSMVAFARPQNMGYFPTWMEFAVSLGIVSAAVLAFVFFVEHFRVYVDEEAPQPAAKRSFHPAGLKNLLPTRLGAPRRFSLAVLTGAAAAVLFLPGQAFNGAVPVRTPVLAPRTIVATAVTAGRGERRKLLLAGHPEVAGDEHRVRVLMIDGNRNGDAVLFDHDDHIKRLHGDASCKECHHLNLPFDEDAPCSACHRDMYEPTSTFDHALHVRQLNGNAGCVKCHKDPGAVKNAETAAPCAECHKDLVVAGGLTIAAPHDVWRMAGGYVDAMHGLCVKCHETYVAARPADTPKHLERCDTCHDADRSVDLERMKPDNAKHGGGGNAPAVASRGIR